MGAASIRSPDPTRTTNGAHQPRPASDSIHSLPLSPDCSPPPHLLCSPPIHRAGLIFAGPVYLRFAYAGIGRQHSSHAEVLEHEDVRTTMIYTHVLRIIGVRYLFRDDVPLVQAG